VLAGDGGGRAAHVARNCEAGVGCENRLGRGHHREAGLVREGSIGGQDVRLVGRRQEALCSLPDHLVYRIDEQDTSAPFGGFFVRQMTTQASIGEL